MEEKHPNVALVEQLDLRDIAGSADIFSDDVVWHFFNPRLPELQGDYVGLAGIAAFFGKLAAATVGAFRVEPVSLTAIGDELVVAHTRNSLTLEGRRITTDVVLVWRIVSGRIAEVWDIPSVHAPQL